MSGSWPAPGVLNSSRTICSAPSWWRVISVRNMRSNSRPRAAPSCASCAGVSIPGIIIPCECSSPGTAWRRSASQAFIIPISSRCEMSIFCARRTTLSDAPWPGAIAVICSAWAWCPIMCCMKRTSATV